MSNLHDTNNVKAALRFFCLESTTERLCLQQYINSLLKQCRQETMQGHSSRGQQLLLEALMEFAQLLHHCRCPSLIINLSKEENHPKAPYAPGGI